MGLEVYIFVTEGSVIYTVWYGVSITIKTSPQSVKDLVYRESKHILSVALKVLGHLKYKKWIG